MTGLDDGHLSAVGTIHAVAVHAMLVTRQKHVYAGHLRKHAVTQVLACILAYGLARNGIALEAAVIAHHHDVGQVVLADLLHTA